MEEEAQELAEEESEGRTLEVVDVDEGGSSDDGETLDERAKRRNLRTAEMVEVDGKLVESATRAVEDFQLAERNRKGKQMAIPSKKREPRPASLGVPIQEAATSPTHNQEREQHVGAFERVEIDLDQKLLEAMVHFKDPKLRRNCAGRVSESRPAQSGRKIHYPLMRMIGVEEQFFGYIRGIGFGWLLEHALCEVPVNLAKEFFTSFHFEYTTDLDEESIQFRVFNQDMVMNLREWSLRLGLLSPEKDERGDWSLREIGQPKQIVEFNAEEAWKLIRAKGASPIRTSESRGEDIADPVL